MKRSLLLFLAPIFFLISQCDFNGKTETIIDYPAPIEISEKTRSIISNGNDFGIQLFVENAKMEQKNAMLSPMSAHIMLTMLLNGTNGETKSEMQEVLGFDSDFTLQEINSSYVDLVSQLIEADPKVTLAIANAVFYRNGLDVNSTFIETISKTFDSKIDALDFSHPSAVKTINDWAAENTNNKIPKVLDSINPEHVMFLMNALYFKGNWSEQFDSNNTSDGIFHLTDGSEIEVPTMRGKINIHVSQFDEFLAFEMPYGRKNFSMVVLLPKNDLANLYEVLTPDVWKIVTNQLDDQTEWQSVPVEFPKFNFEYEKQLNEILQNMGMLKAFSPLEADLTGISESADLYLGFVKQNTFVEVNEEGTEAAAVTVGGIEATSAPTNSVVVNKPFVFAIRERTTNSLLFIGTVVNPKD